MVEYRKNRGDTTCTVYFPRDCKKNCKFCSSKEMYSRIKMDPDAVIAMMDQVKDSDKFNAFAFTGGEPVSDLAILKEMVKHTGNKPIYINTNLPRMNDIWEIVDFLNKTRNIEGVNISRHLGVKYPEKDFLTPEELTRCLDQDSVHINTLVNDSLSLNDLDYLAETFGDIKNVEVCLRSDYNLTTEATLKNRDKISNLLFEHCDYFLGMNGCPVCSHESFSYSGVTFNYHRGLHNSSFQLGNRVYYADAIILPDGAIHHDWIYSGESEDDFLEYLKTPRRVEIARQMEEIINDIRELKESFEGGCDFGTRCGA